MKLSRTAVALAMGLASLASTGCSADPKGAVVLAVSTDLQTPKDISVVSVFVETNGVPKFDYLGRVTPDGTVILPSTLAIVEPDDPSAQVHIRVLGFKDSQPVVLRDVLTTVPHARTVLLRVPLSFVDEGSVTSGTLPSQFVPDEKNVPDGPTAWQPMDPSDIKPFCDYTKGQTMVSGACADDHVDSSHLDDFDPALVDGDAGLQPSGQPAACFDVGKCFQGATEVTGIDLTACTFPLPAGADPKTLNLAVVQRSAGVCQPGGECFVALTQGPLDHENGFSVSGGTVSVAPSVCSRFLAPSASLGPAKLFASVGTCPTETSSSPVCEPVSATVDGGVGPDAGGDATLDGGDGGGDATVDGGGDATTDGADGAGGDVVVPDASEGGPDCAAVVAALLGAPIMPPNGWLGLDLSNGGASDGGPGSGGLSIDQAAILGCATTSEPQNLEAGVAPMNPGLRIATFGPAGDAGAPITVQYNEQSHVIAQVSLGNGYGGRLTFQSRSGGAYGSHSYSIALGPPADAGAGTILRDGTPMPADWVSTVDDAGVSHASAFLNELYDGLMATFDPGEAAVPDCSQSTFTADNQGIPVAGVRACLVAPNDGAGSSVFGVRKLGLYLYFTQGTSEVTLVYDYWPGGLPNSCATPLADTERLDFSPISPGNGGTYGGVYVGANFAGLPLYVMSSNPMGLTVSEANTLNGCSGATAAPLDTGYGATQWASGDILMEYNLDSGLNYKTAAQGGYKGVLAAPPLQIGLGTLQLAGDAGAMTVDWTSQSTAALSLTSLSNAYFASVCGANPGDTDCTSTGNCNLNVDDGMGHSIFNLTPYPMICNNLLYQTITLVFAQGTNVVQQIVATNPNGM